MATVNELIELARAKEPRNGLAEIAQHFISGADTGYDAGKKAQIQQVETILKQAQADEAKQKARELQIQNDAWQSLMDTGKGTGDIPMTAGEMVNGRVATNNTLGERTNKPKPTNALAKLAQMFAPPGSNMEMSTNIKTPFGTVSFGPKHSTESSETTAAREKRLLKEKIWAQALAATQAEDPMAQQPNAKYIGQAASYYGEDPTEYVKAVQPPAVNDPFGLLGQGGN